MTQAPALGRSEGFRGGERTENSQEDRLDMGHRGERNKTWGWGVLEEEIMKLL